MASSPRVWIVTVSDRAAAGERPDASGPALAARLAELGYHLEGQETVADGIEPVGDAILRGCATAADLVVTSGGTGLAPRDLTPEATRNVADREVPGLMELARQRCIAITPFAALSRGLAACVGPTLVLNLPGNPKAAIQTLDAVADVLPHALAILGRAAADCTITGQEGTS